MSDRLHVLDLELDIVGKVENELVRFGLSPREAKTYLYLARFGPKKANKVAEELKRHRTETYSTLSSLQKKGIVTATLERPIVFIALPLEKAVEKMVRVETEKVFLVEKRRQKLFELWRSTPYDIGGEVPLRQFQVFEGIDQVYGRLNEMTCKVQSELSLMASSVNISRLDQEGFLDRLKNMVKTHGTIVKVLVDRESKKMDVVRAFDDGSVRVLPEDITPVPHFVLADTKELIFFTSREDAPRKQISAIWTDYDTFAGGLNTLFRRLWRDSRPVHK